MSIPRARRKSAIAIGLIVFLLWSEARTMRGQSALDGFDPNADGRIQAMVVQPNGKIVIGGNFTTLTPNSVATFGRGRIARLNPDGTVDTGFDANANGIVRAIAVQADGKILIGGDFTVVNKILRNHIARLDGTTGAVDTSFDPNASDIVKAIGVQFNGQVVFGGDFTTVAPNGGSPIKRLHLARVNPSGSLDSTFALDVNNSVLAITLQGDNILLGGAFTSINSTTRNHVARVRIDSSIDTAFDPNVNGAVQAITVTIDGRIFVGGDFSALAPNGGSTVTRRVVACLNKDGSLQTKFNANASGLFVDAISMDAENRVLVGGEFGSMGGQLRNRIARLDSVSGAADSFDPNVNGAVFSIAVQQDAKILVGGFFGALSPDGGAAVTRNFIARLEIDGRLDQTLNLGFLSEALSFAIQPDGKILVGGIFDVFGTVHLLRLNTDGTLDNSFSTANDPGFGVSGTANIYAIAVQADDGSILVGGDFTTVGGALVQRNYIVRLKPDGTLDATFDPNANGAIDAIVVLANKQILIGGDFTSLAPNGGPSVACSHIARLNKDGTVDPGFAPNVNDSVDTIAVQSSNNEILVGGHFTQINGGPRNHIALLQQNGLVDLNFDPNANNSVFTMAVQPSGNILVGGDFTSIGGQIRNYIAKVTPTGALDTTFDPNPTLFNSFGVVSIGAQADGKILVGGFFEHIGRQARNFIARLDPTNGFADSFDPSPSICCGGTVSFLSTTIQADGKILVGGAFSRIGGQPRSGFARLSNDTAALQRLIVTPTSVTLTRGGSSPQFSRVTFEFSTDDVNFTSIGEGTSSGSSWILTGLNLPTGQNFIIRARGHYQGGLDNGSESVLGTRQNAFFPGSFVIGDKNAVVGQRVVFWGAQWAKSNSLSGGPVPDSFKGFANASIPASATCGGTWSSAPGNSADPPTGIPKTIYVLVASSINQSGSTISGDVSEIAVVRPDPGYDANPGHGGTGTVVSLSCAVP